MSGTFATTATFSTVDVQNVIRRLKADILMIADSTGAWAPDKAADYAHDVEQLAVKGYLAWVDVTLFLGFEELQAVRYDVDTDAGSLTCSRPGGVMWPRVAGAHLRILIGYSDSYDEAARQTMRARLRIPWTPSNEDASHAGLKGGGGRNYVSNSYGMKRKDWGK